MNIKKLLCIILSLITLSACSTNKSGSNDITQITNDFVSDFRQQKFDEMYKLTNDGYEYFAGMYNADNPNSTVLFDAMSDNLDISITKTEVVDENTANVYAHIKTINMYNVLDDIVKTENPTDSTISDAIEKHSADYVEKDTVFNFIKQDGKWVIESNLGIYSDLSGGYLQYMYEVSVLGMTGEQAKEKYNGNNQQN